MEYLFQPFRFNPELLGLWPRIEERIELVPVDLQIQSVCFNSAEEHEGGGANWKRGRGSCEESCALSANRAFQIMQDCRIAKSMREYRKVSDG
jgi:hypothetical protein